MLPPEIHYLVIDHSASDQQELSRLSLVSPTWTAYAQSFLFAQRYYSATPALGLHVRRLRLRRANFDLLLDESWEDPAAITEFLDPSLLHECLLRISGSSIKSLVPLGTAAAATFARITTLSLAYLHFPSSGVFFALIRIFPELRALELQALEICSDSDVIQSPTSPPNTALHLCSLSG
ncbi:hypothetical protein C8J57DRAFT_1527850 [Mycena rebaudengoi]|nr:hypothetical protein C8J57DRAFT_1527850 [Mycena rebaudengoi]